MAAAVLRRRVGPLGLLATGLAGVVALAVNPASATSAPSPALAQVVVTGAQRGTISRDLFGANLLWPYASAGAFDTATGHFYPAFVALVRRLGVTALRYPGGATADSFQWERAIGPLAGRQDNEPYGVQGAKLAHQVIDGPVPSVVGPDEFGALLGATRSVGNVVVNFATGTAEEAADLVAYMTAPATSDPSSDPGQPSYWAALRAENGHPAPYEVTWWEVGNEQSVPAEYGWRSGGLVSLGPHSPACPKAGIKMCLYAFGGTTRFADQPVGTFSDELPSAALSTGSPHQQLSVYYPPVVPDSETVMVDGIAWRAVRSLATAGPGAEVYAFDPSTGTVTFGDGRHGAVPPAGARVTADYESGPHSGFVEFYADMKAMNPDIQVCQAYQPDVAFLKLMGTTYPYDCVEDHPYAVPTDVRAPLTTYEEQLMAFPRREGAFLARLQRLVRRWSGRHVPVVVTEYGQLVAPMPHADPRFILSLDEAILVAAQLRQWIEHGVPLAEKYVLTSSPFLPGTSRQVAAERPFHLAKKAAAPFWEPGLSIGSAMIAGPGPSFLAEPSGQVVGLMSRLAGAHLLRAKVVGGPAMPGTASEPVLLVTAAQSGGRLDLLAVNTSPVAAVRTRVELPGVVAGEAMKVSVLDGSSPTAYNTSTDPGAVRTRTRTVQVRSTNLRWRFPAHSVSLLEVFSGTAG